VIEPQGQILWQKVSFRHDYDGLGDVALGDTTGPSGRIGLRTKWTIATAGGQVWQLYLRANLWRDWGAEANTVFFGADSVPLASQTTMLELGGGLTGRINTTSPSSPVSIMSSRSASPTVRNETAFEAHLAPDTRGDVLLSLNDRCFARLRHCIAMVDPRTGHDNDRWETGLITLGMMRNTKTLQRALQKGDELLGAMG
jgi:Autotransporter beta-domain